MLFSNDRVAQYINLAFEPAWESVRPVPIVRIDFGSNNVITRTLNGNIATYVCAADGQLLDVLPGIYEPDHYQRSLEQLKLLAAYVDQAGKDRREARLHEYHVRQGKALEKSGAPHVLVESAGITKRVIEKPAVALVAAGPASPLQPSTPETKGVAGWKTLVEDTRLNETVRRRKIHEILAGSSPVRPEQVTKVVYKDVLHADLDDPYLGLGPTLFGSYPFAAEDRVR